MDTKFGSTGEEDKSDVKRGFAITPTSYINSNDLIFASYQMSSFTQKTLATAFTSIRNGDYTLDGAGGIHISLNKAQIAERLGIKVRNSLYKELDKVSEEMLQKVIRVYSDETSEFIKFTLCKNVSYLNGVLNIEFYESMTPILTNDTPGEFTLMNSLDVGKIKGKYTIRFFNLCRKYEYQAKTHNGRIEKKLHYIQIKDMIGLINHENPEVEDVFRKYGTDYHRIEKELLGMIKGDLEKSQELARQISLLKKTLEPSDVKGQQELEVLKDAKSSCEQRIEQVMQYPLQFNFTSRVIKTSCEELKKMVRDKELDVCFEYELLPNNFYRFVFFTRDGYEHYLSENRQLSIFDDNNNGQTIKSAGSSTLSEIQFIEELSTFGPKEFVCYGKVLGQIGDIFNQEEIVMICKEADFESEKIMDCYEAMNQQIKKGNFDGENKLGFMLAGVRNAGYKPSRKKRTSGSERKVVNTFNEFTQNEYDFDELEKKLMANGIKDLEEK